MSQRVFLVPDGLKSQQRSRRGGQISTTVSLINYMMHQFSSNEAASFALATRILCRTSMRYERIISCTQEGFLIKDQWHPYRRGHLGKWTWSSLRHISETPSCNVTITRTMYPSRRFVQSRAIFYSAICVHFGHHFMMTRSSCSYGN